eukprot:PhM_4_TR6255/c0_g1_i1/m.3592
MGSGTSTQATGLRRRGTVTNIPIVSGNVDELFHTEAGDGRRGSLRLGHGEAQRRHTLPNPPTFPVVPSSNSSHISIINNTSRCISNNNNNNSTSLVNSGTLSPDDREANRRASASGASPRNVVGGTGWTTTSTKAPIVSKFDEPPSDISTTDNDIALQRSVLFDPLCDSCGAPVTSKRSQCAKCQHQFSSGNGSLRSLLFHSAVSTRHSTGAKLRRYRVEDELKKTYYLLVEVDIDDDQQRDEIKRVLTSLFSIKTGSLVEVVNWKFMSQKGQSLLYILTSYWTNTRTLRSVLLACQPSRLPLGEVIFYASQLASAVVALHRNGLAHGGIRSVTVVLETSPARLILTEPTIQWTTLSQRIGAGAAYLAPEVMAVGSSASVKVYQRQDVWAFGCVLYEMCTGNTPWWSSNLGGYMLVQHIQETRTPPLTSLGAEYAVLSELIARCLEPDTDKRASAEYVLHALNDIARSSLR